MVYYWVPGLPEHIIISLRDQHRLWDVGLRNDNRSSSLHEFDNVCGRCGGIESFRDVAIAIIVTLDMKALLRNC